MVGNYVGFGCFLTLLEFLRGVLGVEAFIRFDETGWTGEVFARWDSSEKKTIFVSKRRICGNSFEW